MLRSFERVVLLVEDLEAATESYTTLLGRDPSWRDSDPARGTGRTVFRLARSSLELRSPMGSGGNAARLYARLEQSGEGPLALVFGTDDAENCVKWLRGRGIHAPDPRECASRDAASGRELRWRTVCLPGALTRGVSVRAVEHLSAEGVLPLAPPSADVDADAAVDKIDHVVVQSRDPDATRTLYGEQLGLRLALDRSFEDRGVRLLFFRVGGVTVEIGARLHAEPETDASDRLWGVAFHVPDPDAAQVRLARAGADVSATRAGHKAGTRVLTVRAPTHGSATLMIGPAPSEGAG